MTSALSLPAATALSHPSLRDPPYDLNEAKSYPNMYTSILTSWMWTTFLLKNTQKLFNGWKGKAKKKPDLPWNITLKLLRLVLMLSGCCRMIFWQYRY